MTEPIKTNYLRQIGAIQRGLTKKSDALVLGMALGNLSGISSLFGVEQRIANMNSQRGLTNDEVLELEEEIRKASERIISLI